MAGVAASAADNPPANTANLVLTNARIYTVSTGRPWATSVAIREGRIAAVGSDRETASWIGKDTRVVDLRGTLVLPGFHDAHAHPVWGGLSYSQCPLYEGNTPAEYQQLVAKCLKEQPGEGWLYGVGWRDGVFTPEGVPTKDLLDEIAPDRPVAIGSVGGHSLWVNSKALSVAGIERDTPDPPNGRIDRDADGNPVGALQESAVDLIMPLLPPPSARAREDALRYGLEHFRSLGIVGWQDANVSIAPDDPAQVIATYTALHERGELDAHVVLALTWDNARGLQQLPEIEAASKRIRAKGLQARTVKFFLDGVLAQRTAALVEPYTDAPGEHGELQIEPHVLRDAIVALDARDFQVHVHAIGDGAVRAALDAFEAARKRNRAGARRHLISHVNLVTPADRPRFAALSVIPIFQPLWARLDDYMRMTAERVGPERMQYMYPSGTLLRAGAHVAYGSDWSVASANPFEGIEVALTRRDPGATSGEVLAPQERVTLQQAIRSYTIEAAYANQLDELSGSIEVGKSADMVLLDRDLFSVPTHEIAKTKIVATLYGGEVVYGEIRER